MLHASAPASSADGKAVYAKACAVCHTAMAPRTGDKSAWEQRSRQGLDALVASVVKGKGAMPPKAGNASLTEEEIRAATEYILSQTK
jgi:cytochrome c5